jgi:peptide/nickel transport system substrate-binding protein
MRRYVRVVPVVLAVLATATLSACSTGSGDIGASGAVSQTQGDPVDGGTLRIGLDREVNSLDPAIGQIVSQSTMAVASTMYDALFTYGDDGQIVPQLAQGAEHSDDLLTWTVTVQPNVTFSNGDPLDAQAVIDHVTRLQDPASRCPCAVDAAQIVDMKAVDPNTVEFTLAAPNAGFLSLLTRYLGFIASTEATDDLGNPLGSGPYVLTELVQGSSLSFAQRADYWGEQGHADTVEFVFLPDADSRYQSLVTGAINMMWTETPAQFSQASTDGLVANVADSGTSTGFFNTTKEPFSDLRARQAVQAAIDRSVLLAVVNEGYGAESRGPISSHSTYGLQGDYPAFDPEKSKKLLAEMGSPLSFTYVVDNKPQSQQRATVIQQMLKEVGITMEIKPLDIASWGQALVTRDFQMLDITTSVYGDTDSAMYSFTSGSSGNYSGFASPTIDELVATARATPDADARGILYQEAATLISEQAPVIFYTENPSGFLQSADLRGVPDLSTRSVVTVRPSEFWLAR